MNCDYFSQPAFDMTRLLFILSVRASLAGQEQYEASCIKCLVMGRVFGVSCQLDALGM